MMETPDVERAHRHSSGHRDELLASERCGCFYCLAVFAPAEVDVWIDDEQTALCPRCGIDSVIGSASGFPVDPKFLHAMNGRWFG